MLSSDIRTAAACAVEARLHRSSEEDITVLIDTELSLTLSQQGKTSVGLWRIWCDWLCLESESEVVRVGESESVRGVTTMWVAERSMRRSVTAWTVRPCVVWGSEGRGWGLRRCELKWGSEGEEAGGESWKMRESWIMFIAVLWIPFHSGRNGRNFSYRCVKWNGNTLHSTSD